MGITEKLRLEINKVVNRYIDQGGRSWCLVCCSSMRCTCSTLSASRTSTEHWSPPWLPLLCWPLTEGLQHPWDGDSCPTRCACGSVGPCDDYSHHAVHTGGDFPDSVNPRQGRGDRCGR